MKKTKRKIPISQHAAECLQDLRAAYTDKSGEHAARNVRGSVELGFLRGYQSGYEDCLMKRPAKHYHMTKKEIIEYEKD